MARLVELQVMVLYIGFLLLLVCHRCHERNGHSYMGAFGVPPPDCVPRCVPRPDTNGYCCCGKCNFRRLDPCKYACSLKKSCCKVET
ncbi:hypothetical protein HanIR_Chr17g0891901 [Helianthus annuus]|nr:hypothetical protein HanIR_Chr17g0891901 [Helianthus annuus]